jgi:hypothetical protein
VAYLFLRAHFCFAAGSSPDLVFPPINFIFVSCAKARFVAPQILVSLFVIRSGHGLLLLLRP